MRQLMPCLGVVLVMSLVSASARAEFGTDVWTGGAGTSNYNDANNWQVVNPLSIPTPTGARIASRPASSALATSRCTSTTARRQPSVMT